MPLLVKIIDLVVGLVIGLLAVHLFIAEAAGQLATDKGRSRQSHRHERLPRSTASTDQLVVLAPAQSSNIIRASFLQYSNSSCVLYEIITPPVLYRVDCLSSDTPIGGRPTPITRFSRSSLCQTTRTQTDCPAPDIQHRTLSRSHLRLVPPVCLAFDLVINGAGGKHGRAPSYPSAFVPSKRACRQRG